MFFTIANAFNPGKRKVMRWEDSNPKMRTRGNEQTVYNTSNNDTTK